MSGDRQAMRPIAEQLGLTPAREVALRAVNRAMAAAKARGLRPGRTVTRHGQTEVRSGAGRDPRDPVLFGDALERLAGERGWRPQLSVGGLVSRWAEFVGANIADHSTVESFEDGVLVLRATSSAWATELELQSPAMLRRLEEELGGEVVRQIRVLGPGGQSWTRGRRSVPGRGVRDTYG